MNIRDTLEMDKINLLSGTPLEPMPRLGAHLGLRNLYIKRDDLGAQGGGGNKLRKFERQFAHALREQADTIVIAAHPQSNAAREMAGAAAHLGLKAVIVAKSVIPRKTTPFGNSGNRLLLDLLGAHIEIVDDGEDFSTALSRIGDALRAQGAKPYLLPFGASDALGVLGYVDCAREIVVGMTALKGRAPDLIVVASGTGGTQAGLATGIAHFGSKTRVLGFSVLKSAAVLCEEVERLAQEACAKSQLAKGVVIKAEVDDRALGDGYGMPTSAGLAAIRLVARLEGVFLDPVYTGKAMAGLISLAESGQIQPDAFVVFVHTGGFPLLFAYPEAFEGAGE